eukprot:scaffold123492_cov17-Tisochrysis_lutea.AAC.1
MSKGKGDGGRGICSGCCGSGCCCCCMPWMRSNSSTYRVVLHDAHHCIPQGTSIFHANVVLGAKTVEAVKA